MLKFGYLVLIALFWVFAPAIVLADSHDPKRIMPAEVIEKLAAGEEILFLDTRTTADWASGTSMIPKAIHVKNNEVLNRALREVPRERLIVTYCT